MADIASSQQAEVERIFLEQFSQVVQALAD
jgi:hypothetical protein